MKFSELLEDNNKCKLKYGNMIIAGKNPDNLLRKIWSEFQTRNHYIRKDEYILVLSNEELVFDTLGDLCNHLKSISKDYKNFN